MDPVILDTQSLTTFARRHTALLDAMADVWLPDGRFSWQTDTGQVVYQRGPAGSEVIDVPLAAQLGTLYVAGRDISFRPILVAQARLLEEVLVRETELGLLTDELMRTTDQLVALYEVSAAVRAGRDLDGAMRTCAEQASRLTGAAYALLILCDASDGEASSQVFDFPTTGVPPDFATAVLSALPPNGDSVIANTPEECERLLGATRSTPRRLVLTPIPVGGTLRAGLGAFDKPADFVSGDLKLIVALAGVVAGFLERDRNYRRELAQARVRRELEIAAEIQSRLLPRRLPAVPGVQLVAFSRPAGEVGGDFFDVQVLPANVVALAVGDVSGRGVPAALFMTMALALLRVGLRSTGSPAVSVAQLSLELVDDLENSDMLLTLFVAVFDPATGELRAVNCGHSPVLVYHAHAAEIWEADGPPIGLLDPVISAERVRVLGRGDVLVVLSDGFSEAREASGERVGIAPLVDTLRDAAGRDAAAIAEALRARVAGRGEAVSSDDQTLIVMKVE